MKRPSDVNTHTLRQWEGLQSLISSHKNENALNIILATETPPTGKASFSSFMKRFSSYQFQQVQTRIPTEAGLKQHLQALSKTYKSSENRTLIRHLLYPESALLQLYMDGEAEIFDLLDHYQVWRTHGNSINIQWTDFLGLSLMAEYPSPTEEPVHIFTFFDSQLAEESSPEIDYSHLELLVKEREINAEDSHTYFSLLASLTGLSPNTVKALPQLLDEKRLSPEQLLFLNGELAFRFGELEAAFEKLSQLGPGHNFSVEQLRLIWRRQARCLVESQEYAQAVSVIQKMGSSYVNKELFQEAGKMFNHWGQVLLTKEALHESATLFEEGLSSLAYDLLPKLELEIHRQLILAYKEDQEKQEYHEQMALQLSQQHNLPFTSKGLNPSPKVRGVQTEKKEEVKLGRRGFLGGVQALAKTVLKLGNHGTKKWAMSGLGVVAA
ncbi:MAG: hypothetical protein AAGC85_20540, partial [Bacteroidota bacterium]